MEFEAVKARLDEIVDEIAQDGISLDDALALYEEAVKLGLEACDLSEADILPPEPEPEPEPEPASAEAAEDAPAPTVEVDSLPETEVEAVAADAFVPDESAEDGFER